MGPRSILIVGNYGAGNLGDDAILGGIVTELKSLAYGGRILVTHGGFKSSPEIYKGLEKVPFIPFGLRSRFRKSKKEAYQAIKEADLVILGGGGLFMDTESVWAPFIWAAQARACLKLKKPYLCYGQSVGPLQRWWSRQLTKKVFRKAQAIHVRDTASAKLLESWGLKAAVGTDPAFAWLLAHKRKFPKKPALLLSLREWPGFSEKEWEPFLKEVRVFAKRRKLKPILLSMDARDEGELQKLKATGMELFEAPSAHMAFEGFEKAALAVTMRLHASIFALAAGTPCVALSYSPKVKFLFEQLNVKGPFRLLGEKALNGEELRTSLKALDLSASLTVNLEPPLQENLAFLNQALLDFS